METERKFPFPGDNPDKDRIANLLADLASANSLIASLTHERDELDTANELYAQRQSELIAEKQALQAQNNELTRQLRLREEGRVDDH